MNVMHAAAPVLTPYDTRPIGLCASHVVSKPVLTVHTHTHTHIIEVSRCIPMYKAHASAEVIHDISRLHGQESLIICLQEWDVSHSQIPRLKVHVSA